MLGKIIYYITVLGTTAFAEAILWQMTKDADSDQPGWFIASLGVLVIIVSGFMLLELLRPRNDVHPINKEQTRELEDMIDRQFRAHHRQ